MSKVIDGRAGEYDLAVSYFDESDGRSTASVAIDGKTVDSWVWDDSPGYSFAGTESLVTHVIKNVTLDDSAKITISGARNNGEEFRLDRIELQRTAESTGPANLPSFEGAQGFGATTAGGRGGVIVKVTNLNDSGEGSLRWALQDLDMPRIVVFEVGGLIKLSDGIDVNGDVTVAGQTAPGEGITIQGGRLRVVSDDAIIRGLKIRPGDGSGETFVERDGISVGTSDRHVENVVIDSNSLTWATDENAVVWAGAGNVTFSNNIIAEGLDRSADPEHLVSVGMLLGDGAHNVTVLGNLFAHNEHRNPQLLGAKSVEFVNNLVYDYGDNGFESYVGGSVHATANIVGNHFIAGVETSTSNAVRLRGTSSDTAYYLKDNLGPSRPHEDMPETAIAEGSGLWEVKTSPVFAGSGVKAIAARDVADAVLSSVGARGQGLDGTDQRIIDSVLNETGKIIVNPGQVGGYDVPTTTRALPDSDDDGIPDQFELIIGSDPNHFDPHGDVNGDNYTNIENYFNGLLDGFDDAPPVGIITPPTIPSTSPGDDIHVEAEDLTLVRGFVVDRNPHASDGSLIRAGSNGAQEAEYKFSGAAGVYDLEIDYFDESDGESALAVEVDGRLVDNWVWDSTRGGAYVDRTTAASHRIEDLRLDPGDVVTLIGTADGAEPLRIDALDFIFESV